MNSQVISFGNKIMVCIREMKIQIQVLVFLFQIEQ